MDPIADLVANWCKLDIELFRRLYERSVAGTDASTWSMLVAQASAAADTPQAMAELRHLACVEALRVSVLGELALSLSNVQTGFRLSTKSDADGMVAKVISADVGGRMHALMGLAGCWQGKRCWVPWLSTRRLRSSIAELR